MPTLKDQVLQALYEATQEIDEWLDVSAPDCDGEQTVIFESWEQLSKIQDFVNQKLSPNWPTIRPHYVYAHGIKRATDMMRYPNAYPGNWGMTGGPFATLRTHNGELSTDAILGHVPLYLVPEGVIEIDSVPGLDTAFSDSVSLCSHCNCALCTDYEEYTYDSEGYLCHKCAPEFADEDEDEDTE